MKPFYLIPTLTLIEELYQRPFGMDRFQNYLKLLHGDSTDDLKLPISFYNPMAKPLILEKVRALRLLGAEERVTEVLKQLNGEFDTSGLPDFGIALNLSDDLLGGWTNRFTTDFDSKFKTQALLKRRFGVVLLWSSEEVNLDLIEHRVRSTCYRTIYQFEHGRPLTLQEHVNQELFVARKTNDSIQSEKLEREGVARYLKEFGESDDYHRIFHFFYGDEACNSLGYPVFEI